VDFTSPDYYIWFLPMVIFGVLVLSRGKKNIQLGLILLFSYIFFLLASGWHILLLMTSTILDWKISNKIWIESDQKRRKRLLKLTLTVNLGLLATFKYLDMIIETYNLIPLRLSSVPEIDPLGLLLPVGISFYTFQTMSYSIDVYREKYPPYESFVDFAAYAAFFPQLVAGPIVRADDFLEQIKKPLSFSERNFRLALTFLIYGLVKKLVFANNMAAHVDVIFVDGVDLTNTALIWWGTLCFGIQIYCDFSAYTDIAIGSALFLGIRLPENFHTPYAARSPQDFWRRWHISLSTWLRDYLYISLGGSRNGTRRLYFALMTTMALGGLWHGASWNFVLWGFVHGIALIIHRLVSKQRWSVFLHRHKILRYPTLVAGWFGTQVFIFFTWLIFRVEDWNLLKIAMQSFVGINSTFDIASAREALPSVQILTFILVICFVLAHGLSGLAGKFRERLAITSPFVWGAVIAVFCVMLIYLRPAHPTEFIYFRF
jgi:alginate O-acetyltransferase complex protein AlgI